MAVVFVFFLCCEQLSPCASASLSVFESPFFCAGKVIPCALNSQQHSDIWARDQKYCLGYNLCCLFFVTRRGGDAGGWSWYTAWMEFICQLFFVLACIAGINTSSSIVQNRWRTDLFTLLMLKRGSFMKEHFSIVTVACNKNVRCYSVLYCTLIWVLSRHTIVAQSPLSLSLPLSLSFRIARTIRISQSPSRQCLCCGLQKAQNPNTSQSNPVSGNNVCMFFTAGLIVMETLR